MRMGYGEVGLASRGANRQVRSQRRATMEKRIYIRVPEQLLKDFDRACEANYTTKSEVLRRAMLDYVRQNQKEEEE